MRKIIRRCCADVSEVASASAHRNTLAGVIPADAGIPTLVRRECECIRRYTCELAHKPTVDHFEVFDERRVVLEVGVELLGAD